MNIIIKLFLFTLLSLLIITSIVQIDHIVKANAQLGTYEEYYVKWSELPLNERPANYYNAYIGTWSDTVKINQLLPLSVLITFFLFVGYLYYYDWKYEPQLEMFGRYGGYYEL